MSPKLDATYWNERYSEDNTPWDIGDVSPPLKNYFDKLSDKTLRILIPGAGFAHEAIYLHQIGFQQVVVCDWAENPLQRIRNFVPSFPTDNLICKDFFALDGKFDLIVEQTFFCALSPTLRTDYARKVAELLQPKGVLTGLLFDFDFETDGPPFGGSIAEYQKLFTPYFKIKQMNACHSSIKPRLHREVFIELQKR